MKKPLQPFEYKWITKRLKIYGIKYAEVYNEIYDHMVSAIESKRSQGDTRDISLVFYETIKQDLGGKEGITRLAEERVDLFRSVLQTSFKSEFGSYFRTWRMLIFIGIALFVFVLGSILGFNAHQLVLAALLFSAIPFLFLLVIGARNGYFRTVTSRRKPALVNRLMFNLSFPVYIGLFAGLFLETLLREVFSFPFPGTRVADALIDILGLPGSSVLIAAVAIYTFSFIKVARTDYKQLIAEVVVTQR